VWDAQFLGWWEGCQDGSPKLGSLLYST